MFVLFVFSKILFFLDVCKSFFPQAACCCFGNHKHFAKDKCPCVEGRLRRRRFRLGVGFGFAASFTIGFDARTPKIPCFRTCSLLSTHTSPLPTPPTTLHCSKDSRSTLGRSACTHRCPTPTENHPAQMSTLRSTTFFTNVCGGSSPLRESELIWYSALCNFDRNACTVPLVEAELRSSFSDLSCSGLVNYLHALPAPLPPGLDAVYFFKLHFLK